MIETEITIVNKLGLHARAAAKFVNTATEYASEIRVGRDKASVSDAKSIMSVMMLGAAKGSVLYLNAEGPDEQQALDALCDLVDRRFDEEE